MLAISDIHLGSRNSRSKECLEFIKSQVPLQTSSKSLYLLGDIFDFYKWKYGGWEFKKEDWELLEYIMSLKDWNLYYTPGNHDELFRDDRFQFYTYFPRLRVADTFAHFTTSKKYLMLHGDRFDGKERLSKLWYLIGDSMYESLLWISNRCLPKGNTLPGKIKSKTKSVVNFIQDYEKAICSYAKNWGYDGVVCGHIHTPIDKIVHGIHYLNCGSWITGEYNGAVVEENGILKLKVF